MAKPEHIELPTGERIPILYEDRSVLAIDKPRDWMLVPFSWQKTNRNLQAALTSSIAARDFWARSRGLRFLRFVHRLDAETTGILLLAKSQGAVASYGDLFESRKMEKTYLAVVAGVPKQTEWTCRLKIGQDPKRHGRMRVDARHGKEAETQFRVLQAREDAALVEARPLSGRTHQIRVHLAEARNPVMGDEMYGTDRSGAVSWQAEGSGTKEQTLERVEGIRRQPHTPLKRGVNESAVQIPNISRARGKTRMRLGLRAVGLAYMDPFTRRRVQIRAPMEEFVREYGFEVPKI
jgi:RluA family pseudouridine synthase